MGAAAGLGGACTSGPSLAPDGGDISPRPADGTGEGLARQDAGKKTYKAVDVHTHLIFNKPQDSTTKNAEVMAGKFVQTLSKHGYDKAVLLSVTERLTLETGCSPAKVMLQNDICFAAKKAFPQRLEVLSGLDYRGFTGSDWSKKTVDAVTDDIQKRNALGIKGHIGQVCTIIKLNEQLGLKKDHMFMGDGKLSPVFNRLGQLGGVALIHVGDMEYPGYPTSLKPFSQLNQEAYDAFETLVAAHPKTTFIMAHLACLAPAYPKIAAILDKHTNVYLDSSARFVISTTALLPATAAATRQFFIAYQDRILLGTDYGPFMEKQYPAYEIYGKWLNGTAGNSFTNSAFPGVKIYQLGLNSSVVHKVMHTNYEKLFSV